MKTCVYCGKQLVGNKRKYCGSTCKERFEKEGPAREQFVYREVQKTVDTNVGAWMMFSEDHGEEQAIGDFIRVWKRAPAHCVTEHKRLLVGPVWEDEELDRRWKS